MDRKCCLFCDELVDRLAAAQAAASKTNTAADTGPTQSPSNTSSGKCHQPGPVLRNPFLNYMRYKRQHSCSFSITAAAKEAGREWRNMSEMDKYPFMLEALHARPRPRRTRRTRFSSSMSLSRSGRRALNLTGGGSFMLNSTAKPRVGRSHARMPRSKLSDSMAMSRTFTVAKAAIKQEPTAGRAAARQKSNEAANMFCDW